MNKRKPIPCPVCHHRETMSAREQQREPIRSGNRMYWRPPPGGYKGQQVTRWDDGTYECEVCGLALIPYDAEALADATGAQQMEEW
jgi:hypothetical protein